MYRISLKFFRKIRLRTLLRRVAIDLTTSTLIVAMVLGGFGGIDLFTDWHTPFAATEAQAAYTGKRMRTVEYALGGGTDNTPRGDNIRAYAGTTWSTTKSSAGLKSIVLEGSGIKVKHAFLDVSFMASTTVNVNDIGVTLDVEGASSSSTDAQVGETASTAVYNSSGPVTSYLRGQHDVTALFDRQSDALWNQGVHVVAGIQVDYSNQANSLLTSVKLVLTYEEDYAASAHDETKTVRFPLLSTTVGDSGSRQNSCAGGATCSFQYHAYIPDATSDADILDVTFQLQAANDGSTVATMTPQISGGSAGPTFNMREVLADDSVVNILFQPAIGGSNFGRNATQTLDIINGPAALSVLGGEVVVTYRYSTGAAVQTETVRYYLDQRTSAPGTTRNDFATTTVTIDNSGKQVRNIWYKVNTAPVSNTTLTIYGKVGGGSERSKAYAIASANPRGGNTPSIILDLSSDVGQFSGSSVALAGATQFSLTGGSPPGVEAFMTFTWDGTSGNTETQTILFSGGMQGVVDAANYWNNKPVNLFLNETVLKTYRSAYLETTYSHSDATSITAGTVTIGVNANTMTVTETSDATNEGYTSTLLYHIATTTFASSTGVIPWTHRVIEINETRNVANEGYYGNIVVVSYSVAFAQDAPVARQKIARTVEYMLGGGTDNASRGDNVLAYAGTSWNTTKGSAGSKYIALEGTNIRVKNAYLETSFLTEISANVLNVSVVIDVAKSSSDGTDTRVSQEISAAPWVTSGATGYVRSTHDVTALFDRQTDTDWSNGFTLIAGVQVDTAAAGSRRLTTTKLVITYEVDYLTSTHDEVKTVRFPLRSTAGGDSGTRQSACAGSATCSFTYTSDMPDGLSDGDVLDVFYEITASVDSGTASTLQPQINGGSAGPAFNWGETFLDNHSVHVAWVPSIGGSNFLRNTTQTLDMHNGTVPLHLLGGEVVVTYKFSTDATQQTETVQYFLDQATTTPDALRRNFATTTLHIANGSMVTRDIWYKIHAAATSSLTMNVYGKVGTSSEQSQAYTFSGTNPRSGRGASLIFDLTAVAGNFYASSTDVSGGVQYSDNGGAPVSIEAYVTYTWNGREGGPRTNTVKFAAAQQGSHARADKWNNTAAYLFLPEIVTKTYRSAYVQSLYHHTQSTAVTPGIVTVGVNAAPNFGTTTVPEVDGAPSEAYAFTIFAYIPPTTLATSTTINWNERAIEINQSHSSADQGFFGNVVVLTYDADLSPLYPRFTQNYFRFYTDATTLRPTDPWSVGSTTNLAENAEITASDTPPFAGEPVRIRMSLTIASTTVASSSQAFTLQYGTRVTSCSAISSWSDVGASGSGAAWRATTTALTDGTPLSTNPPAGGALNLSVSTRAGTFESVNPSASNPWPYVEGDDVEYDWLVSSNGATAATNTPYCFRMVKSGGTALDAYTYYPVVRTAGFVAQSKNWRWYGDETNETPTSALAAENNAPVNIAFADPIKLRVTLAEANNVDGVNQKFRLQFSETSDFSSGVRDVVATSSCVDGGSLWCYANGVDVDDDAITTRVLSDSVSNGRHNEAPTTTSSLDPAALSVSEHEFTIRSAGANTNTVYFFRVYDHTNSRPVAIASGETYPSLATEGATLTFTVSGVDNGTVTEGVTTNGTSTATTVPFGTISINATTTLAQRLTVSTNAPHGYTVYLSETQDLISGFGDTITDIAATNTQPLPWTTACPGSAKGCFGYHSGDNTLADSTRFLIDDTFAAATSTAEEVAYNSGPVTSDIIDVVYRVFVRPAQEAGQYATSFIYTIVPIF